MSVNWLRRIKVTAEPTMTKDETSKYRQSLRHTPRPASKWLEHQLSAGQHRPEYGGP